MRRRINADRQSADDTHALLAQITAERFCCRNACNRRAPRTDNGDAPALRRAQITLIEEHIRWFGNVSQGFRIHVVRHRDKPHIPLPHGHEHIMQLLTRRACPQQRQAVIRNPVLQGCAVVALKGIVCGFCAAVLIQQLFQPSAA